MIWSLAQRGFPAPIHLSDQLPQCNLFNRPCKVRIAIQSTNLGGRAISSTDQAFKQASRALVQSQAHIWLGGVRLFLFCIKLMHPKSTLTSAWFWELFHHLMLIHLIISMQSSDPYNLLNHLHLPKNDSIVQALTLTSGASY